MVYDYRDYKYMKICSESEQFFKDNEEKKHQHETSYLNIRVGKNLINALLIIYWSSHAFIRLTNCIQIDLLLRASI